MMDLIESEWFCLVVLLAGTILAVLHVITGTDWLHLVMMLVAHKAVTGALDSSATTSST